MPSACCQAPVRLVGYDRNGAPEGQTQYFVCEKCEKPCDTIPPRAYVEGHDPLEHQPQGEVS